MPSSLPPLPKHIAATSAAATPMPPQGGGSTSGGPASGSSPLAGGLSGIQQYMQMIEAGSQGLASVLPSLTPILAELGTKLRMAIPSAVGAGASQGPPSMIPSQSPGGGAANVPPGAPAVTGGESLPLPPA